MRQNINLLNALPKPSRYELTAIRIGQIWGGFIALLLCITILHITYSFYLHHKASTLRTEARLSSERLIATKIRYPVEIQKQNLDANIANLAQEASLKQTLIDIVTHQANHNPDIGLSSYLRSLGNAIVPGVWLTRIQIENRAGKASLAGYAEAPMLAVKFLQNLRHQPGFTNKTFNAINVLKDPAADNGTVTFTLATQEPQR